MNPPPLPAPDHLDDAGIDGDPISSLCDFTPDPRLVDVQPGGLAPAASTLRTFLRGRDTPYIGPMSSPLTGPDASSRLSPHLAWGTLSARTVWHHLRLTERRLAARRDPASMRRRPPRRSTSRGLRRTSPAALRLLDVALPRRRHRALLDAAVRRRRASALLRSWRRRGMRTRSLGSASTRARASGGLAMAPASLRSPLRSRAPMSTPACRL
ncbi:MAG: hypothetical protein EA397_19400 [Deltaproteobacteria bacterium]|nr:MAG: hypothetical protein EA397_19400 [Deltaproteobacteria bacterium]